MQKVILLSVISMMSLLANAQYDHLNMNFLGRFDDSTVVPELTYGIRYQGCWGYTDSLGREYGIIGSTAGTYIIDVTNPSNLVMSDYIAGRLNDCIWHEYRSYGNYLYIISDDGGNNSLQIADLSSLPDSAYVVYDSTDIFVHAHTLTIDGGRMYVASVATTTDLSSMNVYSLADPTHPTLLRRLDQDYPLIGVVHDMYVVNDTVYASCGNDGLFIFRFDTVMNQFVQLGSWQNPIGGYNHSSQLSPDHQTLYVCEEVPNGRPVHVLDITDIANPTEVNTFFSHTDATPHNPYLKDSLLFIAYYQDGVYVYDVTNPHSPVLFGLFDTYPANQPGSYPWPAYAGAWGAYVELPSGIILVSDIQSGLFTLEVADPVGISHVSGEHLTIYPNPTTNMIRIAGVKDASVEIMDMNGERIFQTKKSSGDISVDLSSFSAGIYTIRIINNDNVISRKFVKTIADSRK